MSLMWIFYSIHFGIVQSSDVYGMQLLLFFFACLLLLFFFILSLNHDKNMFTLMNEHVYEHAYVFRSEGDY